MNNPILGIDTWEGQLSIDESVLLANDVKFMFIRLNDITGGLHKDAGFDKQWGEAVNFCRAPYFVYNPWVSGSANYLWLQSNMPADAKAVGIDIEVIMPGYSPVTYASEVAKFTALVKLKWNYVIYTGEWFLSYLSKWDVLSDYWWAQYPQDFYPAQPVTMTWDDLRIKLVSYTVPSNSYKVPGRLRFWQFSGDKLIMPGNAKPMDTNVYFGTLQNLYDFMGQPAPIPPETDITTQPHPGMTRVSGFRNGWKFELFISDPSQIRFEVVCVNGLETVSNITKSHNAALGVNGGEWDRISAPKDYTVSNGKVCHPRMEAVPSLLIREDGTVWIDYSYWAGTKQAISGLRYLLTSGVISSYLDGTEPQYIEGHARSIHGVDNRGYHMVMQSEGMYPNQGLTLKQAAEIMQQYGAVTAFDSGGGGDVACCLDGFPLIIPENIDPATGLHFERPLPVVFLAYAKGASMNGVAKENLGKIPTIRSTPSVVTGNDVMKGTAFMTVQFTGDPVPDLNPASTLKWLHLTDGNYVNYTDSSHTGAMAYFVITQQPTVDPPPPPPAATDKMVISITQNGVTKTYTSNGTITVS